MKRKIAWFMSAMMLFSSVPSGSVNVFAESIRQEAELMSDSAGISDTAQNMAKDSIKSAPADPVQNVSVDSISSDAADSEGEFEAESETGPEVISVGSNTVNITAGMRKSCLFTAPEDGTYRFRVISECVGDMIIEDSYGDELYMESLEDEYFIDWTMTKDEICYVNLNVAEAADETLVLSVIRVCEVHTPAEGSVVITDPTCTEEGYTTYTCEECGESVTGDYTDATGHQYAVTESRDATCTEDGYALYTCDVCGDEYEEYVAPYHQLDKSGRCTVCQEISPNVMMNAELAMEEEETYIAVEYDTEEYCTACIEIYEEDSEELFLRKTLEVDQDENTGKVFLDEELPQYYIITAYLINTDTEKTISNTYTNLFHTRGFEELYNYVPTDFEEERTVDLSDGNFGIFARDTVVIRGNAEVNTLAETSDESVTYTLTNTDDQADSIVQGCNLAYFYDDELNLVVHVSEVSRPAERTVTITVEQPELEEVFEKLRIDTVVQDQVCTVDLSGLPQGVSYEGAAASTQYSAAAAARASELAVTQTTLSASQKYSFTGVKIQKAELNGNISVDMKFPIKLCITQSQQMLQFGVDAALSANASVEGEGGFDVPLGGYWIPLMNGVMYIKINPQLRLETGGSISFGVSAAGSVLTQTDNVNGFQIVSKSFDANAPEVTVEGRYFCGLQVKPVLYISPNCRLAGASLEMGPEVTASLTTPIPEDEQEEGDHTCQVCIDGDGDMVARLEADIVAFKKDVSSSTEFKLRGFEFYYSVDYAKGGRGTCPYIKGKEEDEWVYDYETKVNIYEENICYTCKLHYDGTCTILEVGDYVLETLRLPSTLYYNNQVYSVKQYDGKYVSEDYAASTVKKLIIPETISRFRSLYYSFPNVETVELLGNRKKIGDDSFSGCTSLENIIIPNSVTEIGVCSFSGCTSLENITIPNSVTKIEDDSFSGCTSLENITIPNSVTKIGDDSFSGCTSLENITIPGSVKRIGDSAFSYCSSLTHVTLLDGVKYIDHGAFSFCSSLTHITLADTVEYIGDVCFYECGSLTDVTWPENLKKIGSSAFADCTSLNNITLSDSVEEIGGGAFNSCGDQIEITIGKNVKLRDSSSVGLWYWVDVEDIRTVNLPEGWTEIESGLFDHCEKLEKITIPDSVKRIGGYAFGTCESLKEVNLPEGLIEIGEHAFLGCHSLTHITLPDSVETIGQAAFSQCSSLEKVTIPSGISCIQRYLFEYCSSLKEITMPSGITCIEEWAFTNCVNLEKVKLPEELTKIESEAFHGCSSLKEIYLPEGLREVENLAFSACDGLTKVVIAGKETYIDCFHFHTGDGPDDLKIYGLSGSIAESMASPSEFIPLVKIDEEGHGYVTDRVITQSTCAKPGKLALKCVICEDCGKTYTEELPVSDNHEEAVADPLVPASIGVPGKTEGTHCSACGKTLVEPETIPAIKTVALSQTSYTYNGKIQRPSVTVTDTTGTRLTDAAYTVQYPSGCTNGDTYTVKVIFKGNYKGNKSLSYEILPASQTIKAKVSAKVYSYSKVKAKAQTFTVGASAKTALRYKSSNTKYVTVDKKGKVTIKKGTPGGTYKITVAAAKSTNYNAASRVVTIKINPGSQTIKTKVSSKTYKYAAVKTKKQTFSIGASAATSLSYKSPNTKYVTVSKKGTVTVKKGTPKGTYSVTVTAAKSANYKAAKKVVKVKVS